MDNLNNLVKNIQLDNDVIHFKKVRCRDGVAGMIIPKSGHIFTEAYIIGDKELLDTIESACLFTYIPISIIHRDNISFEGAPEGSILPTSLGEGLSPNVSSKEESLLETSSKQMMHLKFTKDAFYYFYMLHHYGEPLRIGVHFTNKIDTDLWDNPYGLEFVIRYINTPEGSASEGGIDENIRNKIIGGYFIYSPSEMKQNNLNYMNGYCTLGGAPSGSLSETTPKGSTIWDTETWPYQIPYEKPEFDSLILTAEEQERNKNNQRERFLSFFN